MIGIYKIVNPNGKVYIGQSVDIEKRLKRYKCISLSTKGQIKIYRSLIKYGSANHKFEIVCLCEESELNEKEREYQELFDCVNNGLNCLYTKSKDKSGKVSSETLIRMSNAQKGNNNFLGKKHSEETKNKMALARIGTKHSAEVNLKKGRKGRVSNNKGKFGKDNGKSKPLYQYDLNNNLIKEWNCAADVAKELNYSAGNISMVCNGKIKTYKNSIWIYK
jgi:group I intron endonuclease